MRNDKLIPGSILVIIGVLFLLDNFNVIDFSWGSFFHLWPILLVIGGVNLVFAHNRSNGAMAVKIAVLVAGMGILIFGGIHGHSYRNHNNWRNWNFNFDDNDHIDTADNDNEKDEDDEEDHASITKVESNGHYAEGYKPSIKIARLNISGGAGSYVLKDATSQLFEADTKEFTSKYVLKSTSDSTVQTLDFEMSKGRQHGVVLDFGNKKTNSALLKLNSNPEWEINIEAGAAKLNFDLSSFKIKKIRLEGGAASFEIKMGQPFGETNLDVSTAASAFELSVPKNAACRIVTETGLSSKSFNGFDSIGDNEYQTPGFDKAVNKMYIKLSGGVSDFKVRQY